MTYELTITADHYREVEYLFMAEGGIRDYNKVCENTWDISFRGDEGKRISHIRTAKELFTWMKNQGRIDGKPVEIEFEVNQEVELKYDDPKDLFTYFGDSGKDEAAFLVPLMGWELKVEKVQSYTMEQLGGAYCSCDGEQIMFNGKPYLFDEYILVKS